MTTRELIVIYAGSSNISDPGLGGWGALLRYKATGPFQDKELSGTSPESTGNRMGLLAVVEGLTALKRPVAVDLYTASVYVENGIAKWMPKYKGVWKDGSGADVPNADLWRRLEDLIAKHKVKFHWLKANTKSPENDRVILMAKNAAQKTLSPSA